MKRTGRGNFESLLTVAASKVHLGHDAQLWNLVAVTQQLQHDLQPDLDGRLTENKTCERCSQDELSDIMALMKQLIYSSLDG